MTFALPESESIVLGGGCFWCIEAAYQLVDGVTSVVSGYAGGATKDPSYDEVSMGYTGHAEVVKVEFETAKIKLPDILDMFWILHDPTTKDRQGYDVGSQYRSIILYTGEHQRRAAEASRDRVVPLWKKPIVTDILPLKKFYEAEEFQQNFYRSDPTRQYCQVVINPKLEKLREKFNSRLKQEGAA